MARGRRYRRNHHLEGAKVLSRRLEEVRYKHAQDGKLYKHRFKKGAKVLLLRDGKVELARDDQKPLWFDDEKENPLLFLTNPRKRRKTKSGRKRRPPPAGFSSWRAYMASIRPKRSKPMAKRRRRHRARARHNPRRRRGIVHRLRRRASGGRRRVTAMVRRRRHHANPRRRRRHFRRNPSFSLRGIFAMAKDGAIGGIGVGVGRIGSKALPDVTGISARITAGNYGSVMATAALALAQITSGILLATVAHRTFGAARAHDVLSGSFNAVYEDLAQGIPGVPAGVSKYLGDGGSHLPVMTRSCLAGYSNNAAVVKTLHPNAATGSRTRRVAGYSGRSDMVRSGAGLGGGRLV